MLERSNLEIVPKLREGLGRDSKDLPLKSTISDLSSSIDLLLSILFLVCCWRRCCSYIILTKVPQRFFLLLSLEKVDTEFYEEETQGKVSLLCRVCDCIANMHCNYTSDGGLQGRTGLSCLCTHHVCLAFVWGEVQGRIPRGCVATFPTTWSSQLLLLLLKKLKIPPRLHANCGRLICPSLLFCTKTKSNFFFYCFGDKTRKVYRQYSRSTLIILFVFFSNGF